jgi:hypothetical protein
MPKAKNVTVIPATLNLHTKTSTAERMKRRVAGYARVSTDSDEQFASYEAQVDYYNLTIYIFNDYKMPIPLPQEQNNVIVPPKSIKITHRQDLNHRLYL